MTLCHAEFYQVGGTIAPEAPCYIRRQADSELAAALSQGEFCYVLTARQMGKSSLKARVAAQLRAEGVAVVEIDLQALGQNLTVGQWYGQMLREIGEQLDRETEIEAFCRQTTQMSPMQQWRAALREIVLRWSAAPLVLFVDEIDYVRSLPFKTDEFFAAIRELYNRRSEEPELRRLAFCLLGVAAPSDLIRDARLTPFNIGHRIELTDFTPQEAAPLATGLGNEGLLARILYWTGGHPYLTQKFCQVAAQKGTLQTAADVDRLCAETFFSREAGRAESNLQFVSSRLLQTELDLAELLGLYLQVLRGRRVADNEANPLVTQLKLSGVVRGSRGRLLPRNRIYARLFDRTWVRTHLPDADLRRQQAAYRRGALRVGGVLAAFLIIVFVAVWQTQNAREAGKREAQQRVMMARQQEILAHLTDVLYAADMNLAHQAWQEGNVGRAVELLQQYRPGKDKIDKRSFEWGYLWQLCHRARFTLRGHQILVYSIAFSPDGKLLASGGFDGRVKVWDPHTGREIVTLKAHKEWVNSVAFSPTGHLLATASNDGTLRLWDTRTFQETRPPLILPRYSDVVARLAFSPDGRLLAAGIGGTQPCVRVWETADWRERPPFLGHRSPIQALAFSPDSRRIFSFDFSRPPNTYGTAILWDVEGRKEICRRVPFSTRPYSAVFSPDGRSIAVGGEPANLQIWDANTLQTRQRLLGHTTVVHSVAFSPDGRTLASASWDFTARLWEAKTGKSLVVLKGHGQKLNAVVFSPDGKLLATGSNDRTVKVWDLPAPSETPVLPLRCASFTFLPDGKHILATPKDKPLQTSVWETATQRRVGSGPAYHSEQHVTAFSLDGRTLANVQVTSAVCLQDTTTGQVLRTLDTQAHPLVCGEFSQDGRLFAIGSYNHTTTIWEVASGRLLHTLRGHVLPVYCVAFSPDGRLLATGSDDNTARLWDVAAGRELGVFLGQGERETHDHSVTVIAFSPDGRLLATGSWDTTAKVWDVASRKLLGTLHGHTDFVRTLAFTPDGRTLATGSDDGTIKLWSLSALREIATLRGHSSGIWGLAFASGGDQLASLDANGELRLWPSIRPTEADALEAIR